MHVCTMNHFSITPQTTTPTTARVATAGFIEKKSRRSIHLLALLSLFLVQIPFLYTSLRGIRSSRKLLTADSLSAPFSLDYRYVRNPLCPIYPDPDPFPGKKGIGRVFRNKNGSDEWRDDLYKVKSLDVYWNYNWGEYRLPEQPDSIEFIPMSWSGAKNYSSMEEKLQQYVKPQIENSLVKRYLGFNEPDFEVQGNMDVQTAIDRWPLLESLNVPLVSPSAAHAQLSWMEEFMGNATELCLRVDYLGVHWYGDGRPNQFMNYMTNLYAKYNLPIVVTEFAPADWQANTTEENTISQADVLAFMKEVLPWMEQTSWIAGYSWFSFDPTHVNGWTSSLFDLDNNLTAIGRYYQSVRNENIFGDQSIEVDVT